MLYLNRKPYEETENGPKKELDRLTGEGQPVPPTFVSPWSCHYFIDVWYPTISLALVLHLNMGFSILSSTIPTPPCLGSKLIYVHLWRLMDLTGFQNALWNLLPSGNLLDKLVEDWHG